MRGIAKTWVAGVLLAGWMGSAAAAAITEGILSGESRIHGHFGAGDMETVLKRFPQGLDRPLLLGVDIDSAPGALMDLADWLRHQRPVLDVDDACAGSCAWLLANTGRAIGVRRGAFLAFDTTSTVMLIEVLRQRIASGELFIDQAASVASRDRFMEKAKLVLAGAQAYDEQVRRAWPAPMLAFVEALRGTLKSPQLGFGDETFDLTFQGDPGRCTWWVPDAQGLRQIGLEVAGYQPPPRERLAKALKVDPALIYIGPMLEKFPAEGLCAPK